MAYREYVEKGYMPSREMMKKFLIEQIDFKRNFEVVDLYNAVDKVSAEDVKAKVILPKLPVSKMDGIGVCFADFKDGIPDTENWQEGKEYIFANTGCVVPEPYDTVILIEDVRFIDGKLKILAKPETKGQLIDPPGSLIGKDEVLVNKYEKITAPQVGLLASGGIKEVKVIARPKIAFIPTGDELVSWQSEDYPVDKNIESNSMMLSAFCKQYQADLTIFPIIPDDKEKIKEALTKASEIADIILINRPLVAGDPPRETLRRPLAVHRPGALVAGPRRHGDQEPHFVARGRRGHRSHHRQRPPRQHPDRSGADRRGGALHPFRTRPAHGVGRQNVDRQQRRLRQRRPAHRRRRRSGRPGQQGRQHPRRGRHGRRGRFRTRRFGAHPLARRNAAGRGPHLVRQRNRTP